MSQPTIYLSEVKGLLETGVTRKNGDAGYNPELGSIESKYGLTPAQVTILFKHPKLKGLKTKKQVEPAFELVDDTAPGFGTPSLAGAERLASLEPEVTEAPSVPESPQMSDASVVEESATMPSPDLF